ncbi:MAG: FAD-dependent oxidoreductase, partial [Armatimonadia bacterium]
EGILQAVRGLQMGNEKVWEVSADFFVDATGDGSIGTAAGVPFRIGQESRDEYHESLAPEQPENWTLGSSLVFRSRDCGQPMPYEPPPWAATYPDEASLQGRPHGYFEGGYWWIEVGYPFDSLTDNEALRDEALRHVLGVWDHIKNRCEHRDRAANRILEWVGMLPAKRESRRFIGAHVLTQDEIKRRELFPDRVSYGGWIIDDHTKGGILATGQAPSFHGTGFAPFYVAPYSVPLRSLYTREVKNLFLAGRCMSASRVAFNSLRVQRTLAVAAQAVGVAASHCAQTQRLPAALQPDDLHAIQQTLLRDDCYIPRVRNQDEQDLARHATITASSTRAYEATPTTTGLPLTTPLATLVPISGPVEQVRIHLRNEGKAGELRGTLHRADDLWDLPALDSAPVAEVVLTVPSGHTGPLTAELGESLARGLYWLRLPAGDQLTWLQQADRLPGITSARCENGQWVFAPGQFSDWRPLAADVLPLTAAFEPQNVTNGVARPEQWTNVWVSDGPAPQWLRLELAAPAALSLVQIAWGLDFHRSYFQMPGSFRPAECARDYQIIAELPDGTDHLWAEVQSNLHRLRRHPRPQDLSGPIKAIRIEITATNGADLVEIDEVRLYQ